MELNISHLLPLSNEDGRYIVQNEQVKFVPQASGHSNQDFIFALSKIHDFLMVNRYIFPSVTDDQAIQQQKADFARLKATIEKSCTGYERAHSKTRILFSGLLSGGFTSLPKDFQTVKTHIFQLIDERLEGLKQKYTIEGNPRPGFPGKIYIPIANVSDLELKKEDLPEIFRRINHTTIDIPYQCAAMRDTAWEWGLGVPRQNHNGTHASRQVRYLAMLLDLAEAKGQKTSRQIVQSLSEREMLNMQLAAYCYRTGRVDESNSKDKNLDNYLERSIQVYVQYAQQLRLPKEEIDWMIDILRHKHPDEAAHSQPMTKKQFYSQLFSLMHGLDLVRCYSKTAFDVSIIDTGISTFIAAEFSKDIPKYRQQLMHFAKECCKATGNRILYDNQPFHTADLFAKCSREGDTCWKIVSQIPYPDWNKK